MAQEALPALEGEEGPSSLPSRAACRWETGLLSAGSVGSRGWARSWAPPRTTPVSLPPPAGCLRAQRARVDEACAGLTCPGASQARSEKSWPPPTPTVRPHGPSPCLRKGREKGQTDVHFSSALRRWTPWSLVLFCILNGLEVTEKLRLLKIPGEFSLENDDHISKPCLSIKGVY